MILPRGAAAAFSFPSSWFRGRLTAPILAATTSSSSSSSSSSSRPSPIVLRYSRQSSSKAPTTAVTTAFTFTFTSTVVINMAPPYYHSISSSPSFTSSSSVLSLRSFATATTARAANKKQLSTTTAAGATSSSIFKPWPVPKVTCRGDYRQEAWLEAHVGGPLYEHQSTLPRLPVPAVKDTLQLLVPTALPLAESEEEARNFSACVQKFEDQTRHLQGRLVERAQQQYGDSSWLQHWWNTWGYLDVRDPITVNVSYFFHFRDDPNAVTGIRRAAALVQAGLVYRNQVCSGRLPADVIGRGPKAKVLDSTAYKYMFHACRIPHKNQDSYELHDPSLHNHVLVLCRGQPFVMDASDPRTGHPYTLNELERGLQDIVNRAHAVQNNKTNAPELGYLTHSNRDDWAAARTALVQNSGPAAMQALERLESAAFCICLDDDAAPVSRAECANHFWHGTSSHGNNRWMDKSIQLIVTANGKAGLVGEHSMMDGMPVVGLADYLTKSVYGSCSDAAEPRPHGGGGGGGGDNFCNVQAVFEGLNLKHMEPFVEKAKSDFEDLTGRHDLQVQSFQGYGSDFIKKAGYSPDAYVQVAMQLATYRLWGRQAGTYEATQVRPFLHGRTETTRAVSTESAEFVKLMGLRPARDEHVETARKAKLRLLQDAVNAHVKYMGHAANARGVDRHLLGLSMLVKEGEPMPDLYKDPVFVRSKRWRVSTSHLTHPRLDGWGYGEVVPDGVGLAYSIHPRHCVFNVTALKDHGWTDPLCQNVEDALLEMRTLVEMDQPLPASKL